MKNRILPTLLLILCLLVNTSAWAMPGIQNAARRKNAASYYNLPVISYEDFEKENRSVQIIDKEFIDKMRQLDNIYAQNITKMMTAQNGVPDYENLVKNVKYIYIGEIHDEPAIQQEIQKLLHAVREANPDKKILLASEFLQVPHPLINPLHSVGKEDWSGYSYDFIEGLSEKLNMDVLSLDDAIVQTTKSGVLIKIGEQYVRFNWEEPEPIFNDFYFYLRRMLKEGEAQLNQDLRNDEDTFRSYTTNYFRDPSYFEDAYNAVKNDPEYLPYLKQQDSKNERYYSGLVCEDVTCENYSDQEISKMAQFITTFRLLTGPLSMSNWGVVQRNLQWARLISQVENNYDIVIVWGGEAHIDGLLPASLNYLLPRSNSIRFNFRPLNSKMSKEDEEDYSNMGQLVIFNGLLKYTSFSEFHVREKIEQIQNLKTVENMHQTFYSDTYYNDRLLPAKQQAQVRGIKQDAAVLIQKTKDFSPEKRIQDLTFPAQQSQFPLSVRSIDVYLE